MSPNSSVVKSGTSTESTEDADDDSEPAPDEDELALAERPEGEPGATVESALVCTALNFLTVKEDLRKEATSPSQREEAKTRAGTSETASPTALQTMAFETNWLQSFVPSATYWAGILLNLL